MSLQRRILVSRLGVVCAAAGLGGFMVNTWAQRPSHPITRPRPGIAGRFRTDGVAGGVAPGLFTVVSVDGKASTLQLRDEAGTTAPVYVNPGMFDVDTLKAGDQVEVDFMTPVAGSPKLEAAGIWPVQR